MVDKPGRKAPPPRIVLAHDWLVARRGGELVLEAIAQAADDLGTLPALYTMFDTGPSIGPAIDQIHHETSPLSSLPGKARRWLLPLYPLAVQSLSRSLRAHHREKPIDLLISTHSSAIKALRPPKGVPHLCYCHAPARYIWNQPGDYAHGPMGLGLTLARPAFKFWDRRTASRVDQFLANSNHTRAMIRRAYKRDASVCHPPVRTDFFTPDPATPRVGHWLAVGALVPYKRFDLVIQAASARNHPLVIIGSGPEEPRLRAMAGPTVSFQSAHTDAQLRDHYRRARLLLFPQVEDFGIVAVEAQACGTPVVAMGQGGALDTVIDAKTGTHFHEQTVTALLEAVDRCPRHNALACREHAERFSEDRFAEQIKREIRALIR